MHNYLKRIYPQLIRFDNTIFKVGALAKYWIKQHCVDEKYKDCGLYNKTLKILRVSEETFDSILKLQKSIFLVLNTVCSFKEKAEQNVF